MESAYAVARRLGKEFGVSAKTVIRDGQFAEALDYFAGIHGERYKLDILSGKTKVSKSKLVADHQAAIGKANGKAKVDDRVALYVKVSPEARDAVNKLANESGLTSSAIVDALIRKVLLNE